MFWVCWEWHRWRTLSAIVDRWSYNSSAGFVPSTVEQLGCVRGVVNDSVPCSPAAVSLLWRQNLTPLRQTAGDSRSHLSHSIENPFLPSSSHVCTRKTVSWTSRRRSKRVSSVKMVMREQIKTYSWRINVSQNHAWRFRYRQVFAILYYNMIVLLHR